MIEDSHDCCHLFIAHSTKNLVFRNTGQVTYFVTENVIHTLAFENPHIFTSSANLGGNNTHGSTVPDVELSGKIYFIKQAA